MKTNTMTRPALNWAVATCVGGDIRIENGVGVFLNQGDGYEYFTPSTDWSQGGPIIERELIDIASKFLCATTEHPNGTWEWQATAINEDDKAFWYNGPTPLIAAMRCYVASKLGDEVDVPKELE